MAFPTTGVIETFTGDDDTSPPNANWTNGIFGMGGGSGLKIASNQGAGVMNDGMDSAWWNVETFGADSEVYVTIPTRPADGVSLDIFLRVENTGDAMAMTSYLLEFTRDDGGGDTLTIIRLDAGLDLQPLGDAIAQAFEDGDSIGLEIQGDVLKAYHKTTAGAWTEVGERTDATYSSAGNIATLIGDTTTRLDNFGGGTVTGNGGGLTKYAGKMLRGAGVL